MVRKHGHIFNHEQQTLETITTEHVVCELLAAQNEGVERKRNRPVFHCVYMAGELCSSCGVCGLP